MSVAVARDPKGSGRWVQRGGGQLMPKGWHIGHLGKGDTYTDAAGTVWTVGEVRRDPRWGAYMVFAYGNPSGKVAL